MCFTSHGNGFSFPFHKFSFDWLQFHVQNYNFKDEFIITCWEKRIVALCTDYVVSYRICNYRKYGGLTLGSNHFPDREKTLLSCISLYYTPLSISFKTLPGLQVPCLFRTLLSYILFICCHNYPISNAGLLLLLWYRHCTGIGSRLNVLHPNSFRFFFPSLFISGTWRQ